MVSVRPVMAAVRIIWLSRTIAGDRSSGLHPTPPMV
jgi:hypothetical protein